MRQHAKIFHDYETRNVWASPEVLKDSNSIFTSKKQTMDTYSFGMLTWELFSMIVPFSDSIEGAQTFVLEKNCRPKIKYSNMESDDKDAPYIPSEIAEVI